MLLKRTVVLVTMLSLMLSSTGVARATTNTVDPDKIVGGSAATEEYPFMVSVQRKNGRHFCGGSLLKPKVVLTAAHCAEDEPPEGLQVMIGSQELDKPGDIYEVKKIIVHQSYINEGTHDVALLKLKKAAKHPTIRIASLDEKDLWAPGEVARVIGWGSSIFLVGPGSNQLNEVDVPMVSDTDCGRSYFFDPGWDPTSMVCAGETTGGKDSCQGDSGGPLMTHDAKGRWIQVGVVSWGIGCGWPTFYGVYARVGDTSLHTWLDTNVPGGI